MVTDASDFLPQMLRLRAQAASPLPRATLYLLFGLLIAACGWAALGRLDMVAVAQGRLVPQTFLKVVQPADSGIVTEILVKEGDIVHADQVLMRMDRHFADADGRALQSEIRLKEMQLRRIDAELRGGGMTRRSRDDVHLYAQIDAQYRARRQAHQDLIDAERAVLLRAQHDLKAALEIHEKLRQTVPIYGQQAEAWDKLARDGFAGKLLALDRQRVHMENAQDLRAQEHTVIGLRAAVSQSEKRLAQTSSGHFQQLHNERVEVEAQLQKIREEWQKQQHKVALLELKAPQAGIVKDLATHTARTVVAPGTILLTLVPHDEPLQAEVYVSNMDIGFVATGQPVKVKLASYPFQKYGMLDGTVRQLSADVIDNRDTGVARPGAPQDSLQYRALVSLQQQQLNHAAKTLALSPGMLVHAEIHTGRRSVLDYLLSPIQKVAHEAGRER